MIFFLIDSTFLPPPPEFLESNRNPQDYTVRRRLSVCVLAGDYVSAIPCLVTVGEYVRLEKDGGSPLTLAVDPLIYIHFVPLIFAVMP